MSHPPIVIDKPELPSRTSRCLVNQGCQRWLEWRQPELSAWLADKAKRRQRILPRKQDAARVS